MIAHRNLLLAWLLLFMSLPTWLWADPNQIKSSALKPASTTPEYSVLQEHPDRLVMVLPNRLVVIVQEIRTAPVVSAQVWIKTGSIYEQEHVGAGLSHFLEHLLSGGSTSTRTENQSNQILGSIGAQVNAATGLENVHYYINTTSDHAGTAVELLTDWMRRSLISAEEYQRERDVIQREFEMGQGDPGRIFWKLTQQTRYQAHPARHPTIGYLNEFLTITRDQIYDFYKRMYVPNNMVFVVVGNVDKQKITRQIAQLWQDAPAASLPKLSFPIEPEIDAPRQQSGQADVRRPRLRLAWPGVQLGEPGDYPLDLLSVILGQGESSRLVQSIRDKQHRVASIQAYNLSFHWGRGFFGIDSEILMPSGNTNNPSGASAQGTAKTTGDNQVAEWKRNSAEKAASNPDASATVDPLTLATQQTQQAILQQIQRIADEGITAEELARAKRQTLASVIYDAQTAHGLASRLARDFIGTGDPDYLSRYSQAIQSVTARDIQDAARKFLSPNRLITVTLTPGSAVSATQSTATSQGKTTSFVSELTRPDDPPQAATLPKMPVDLDNTQLIARYQKIADQPVVRGNTSALPPVERHVLPNGLRVLIARTTTIPAVAMQLYHLGGLLTETPGEEGLANAAGLMMLKGAGKRSAQDIARQIDDLGASLTVDCGNNTLYSRAMCLKEDWDTILTLQADIFLRPTFPEDQWKLLQPRLLAAIDRQSDSWNGELRKYFLASYFPDHPWAVVPLGRRNVIQNATADDLRRFHKDHLGASQTVLAIVGDIDPAQVLQRVRQLYAEMPTKALVPFQAPIPKVVGPMILQEKTNKPLAAVQIGLGPGVTRTSADYPAMQVLSRVLSSFPTGWLDEELRGRGPGLVYAVGAGQMSGLVPGYFAVLFNTEPTKVPQALNRAWGQIVRIQSQPVPEGDLSRAKAAVLADEFMSKQTNADLAADAALNELYGLPLDESQRFLKHIQQLTTEQLQIVAQTYLRRPVVVVLTHQPLPEAELKSAMESKETSKP